MDEQFPKSPTRAGLSVRALIAAILAGVLIGGGFAWLYLDARPAALARGRVVTLQVAAAGEAAAANAASQSTIEAVALSASPSVLEVSTESKATHPFWGSYVTGGAGSAVVLSADGYLVTNNHVVSGATAISVRTHDGLEYPAQLVGLDAQSDLAVLKIEVAGLQPATFADSDQVRVGQLAVVIGNPLGTLGGTVTEGIISAKDRAINIDGEMMTLLQTSAAINPGNSGGGLFDGAGHLVGIVNAKSSGDSIEGLGFAIPTNLVQSVVSDLIQSGYVTGRPALGLGLREVDAWSSRTYRLGTSGVYVVAAMRDLPIELWDRLVQVNGQNITSIADVKGILAGKSTGDTVTLTLEREGRTFQQEVTLREKIPEMTDADMI